MPAAGHATVASSRPVAGKHNLMLVSVRKYPALAAPARRIMTEASPMYSLFEDCVPAPKCAPHFDERMQGRTRRQCGPRITLC